MTVFDKELVHKKITLIVTVGVIIDPKCGNKTKILFFVVQRIRHLFISVTRLPTIPKL
jgi:hypothetical protein